MNNKKSYLYISFLNVLLAIGVVIIHANGSFWTLRNDISWSVNNILKKTSIKKTFKKQILKQQNIA